MRRTRSALARNQARSSGAMDESNSDTPAINSTVSIGVTACLQGRPPPRLKPDAVTKGKSSIVSNSISYAGELRRPAPVNARDARVNTSRGPAMFIRCTRGNISSEIRRVGHSGSLRRDPADLVAIRFMDLQMLARDPLIHEKKNGRKRALFVRPKTPRQ